MVVLLIFNSLLDSTGSSEIVCLEDVLPAVNELFC